MHQTSMKKERSPQSVKLIRILRVGKGNHSTNLFKTIHLRTQRCLIMKKSSLEVTVLSGSYYTFTLNQSNMADLIFHNSCACLFG
uniref:Uncharacterized protein n=1 Tax=Arion vulgaris TaxID=1028688 RepID=A0A0B7ASB0_9EUPU